jgi:hypothetical protein
MRMLEFSYELQITRFPFSKGSISFRLGGCIMFRSRDIDLRKSGEKVNT